MVSLCDTSTDPLRSAASSMGFSIVHSIWSIDTPGATCRLRPTVPVGPGCSPVPGCDPPWPLEQLAAPVATSTIHRIARTQSRDNAGFDTGHPLKFKAPRSAYGARFAATDADSVGSLLPRTPRSECSYYDG